MPPSLSSQWTEPGPRVLIVGNDPDMHKLLHFFLTQAGYQIVSANHVDALSAYQANPFDLVLVDLTLASPDVFGFCLQLRRFSDIPLILLVEVSQPEQVVRGLELGADDAIHYPFAMVELMARMQALLRRRLWSISVGDHLAAKKMSEAEASPTVMWMRDSLGVNQSAFIPNLPG